MFRGETLRGREATRIAHGEPLMITQVHTMHAPLCPSLSFFIFIFIFIFNLIEGPSCLLLLLVWLKYGMNGNSIGRLSFPCLTNKVWFFLRRSNRFLNFVYWKILHFCVRDAKESNRIKK